MFATSSRTHLASLSLRRLRIGVVLLTAGSLWIGCGDKKKPKDRPELSMRPDLRPKPMRPGSAHVQGAANLRLKLTLPTGVSQTAVGPGPVVQVGQAVLAVNGVKVTQIINSRVDASLKRDGPDGLFIDPLFGALKKQVKGLKLEADRGGAVFSGHVKLEVDTKTAYRLLAEVMNTSAEAELGRFQLVVQRPKGGRGVVVVYTPHRVRRRDSRVKRLDLELSVVMTDKGFYIKSRFGSECPERRGADARLCFVTQEGRYTAKVFRDLQHHMWYLFAKKYKDPSHYSVPENRRRVILIPEPTVSVGDVVRALDALREIPGNARNPKLRHRIPASGCSMLHDRKSGNWGFAESQAGSVRDLACMYDHVILALGSS